jgi:hypothetical protein
MSYSLPDERIVRVRYAEGKHSVRLQKTYLPNSFSRANCIKYSRPTTSSYFTTSALVMTTLLSSLLRLPSIASSSRSIHSISTRSIPSPVVVRGLYELPRGLQLTGIVVEAGKMKQTSTVSVASRVTDHKTLKVISRSSVFFSPFLPCLSSPCYSVTSSVKYWEADDRIEYSGVYNE